MKSYTINEPFWHKGILLEKGAEVSLTSAESKHLQHILTPVEGEEKPDAQPTAESTARAEGYSDPREAPAPRDGADPEAVATASRIVSAMKARRQ